MVELMNFLKLSYNAHGIAYSLAKQALEAFLLGDEAFLRYKERIRAIRNQAFLAQFQALLQELDGCTELASEAEHMENKGGRQRFNLLYDYAVIFLGEPVAGITLYKVYSKVCQDIFSFLASVAAESKEAQPSRCLPYAYADNVSENASAEITTQHQLIKTEDAIKKINSFIALYDANALEAYLEKLQNCSEKDRLAIHLMPHLNLNAGAYPLILIYHADQACWFIKNCGDYMLSDSFAKDKFAEMAHKIKQDMGLQHSHEFLLETSFYYLYNQESALKLSATMPFFMAEIGDWESVEALLEEGLVDVNAQAADGVALLHLAVKNGDFCRVRFLLDKGANPNIETKNGETAFTLAVSISLSAQNEIDYEDIIKALIDKGINFSSKKNSLITKEALSDFGVQQCVAEIEKYSQCLNKKWIGRDLAKKKSLALMSIVQAYKGNGTFFSGVQLAHVRGVIQQEEAILSQHRHWPQGILYFFKQPILKSRVSSYKKVMALDHAIKCLLAA